MLAELYAEAAAVVARGERAVMATARAWPDGTPRKLLRTALRTIGDTSLAADIDAYDPAREVPLLGELVVTEALVGAPRLVVFGAGHVGARICEAAAFAGWRVTIVDDRADFADATRLPWAEQVLVCDFGDVRAAAVSASDYVVVCTRGHQHDALIASQVAPLFPRFLGMLGSRRKAALTAQALRSWDVPEAAIERIVCPVGLDVGADTPAEIAISVVGQLVAQRRTAAGDKSERAVEVGDSHGAE
jgi:xanthine/CO dehydrogenase XdhC/CoxF family maturation factor